jgi:hypothetical protein
MADQELCGCDVGCGAQARLNSKVQTAISSVAPKAQVDTVVDVTKGVNMEGGWARRGKGSAFRRTVVSE